MTAQNNQTAPLGAPNAAANVNAAQSPLWTEKTVKAFDHWLSATGDTLPRIKRVNGANNITLKDAAGNWKEGVYEEDGATEKFARYLIDRALAKDPRITGKDKVGIYSAAAHVLKFNTIHPVDKALFENVKDGGATVQGVVVGRMDGLTAEEKQTSLVNQRGIILKVRDFWQGLLDATDAAITAEADAVKQREAERKEAEQRAALAALAGLKPDDIAKLLDGEARAALLAALK